MRSLARAVRGLALSVVLALAGTPAALAAPTFPELTGRVVDGADILSAQAETQLTGELAALEAQTGRQLVVVTLPDLQGYEIEDYGYQLGRAWGIGDAETDSGALFIVAPNQRKVRIEVGYGLEPILTDALSSTILQRIVLPEFREGNMEAGVVAGTEAIIRQLGLPEEEARALAAQAAERQTSHDDGGIAVPIIFVLFIIFWIIGGFMGAFGRGRRRRGGLWWLLPLLISSGGSHRHRGGGGFGGGGFGGGGFSGGGGGFGGGGSSGSW